MIDSLMLHGSPVHQRTNSTHARSDSVFDAYSVVVMVILLRPCRVLMGTIARETAPDPVRCGVGESHRYALLRSCAA